MTEPSVAPPGNGWAPGIIVLLILVLVILSVGFFVHIERNTAEHHAITEAFRASGCAAVYAPESPERLQAALAPDPCKFLRETGLPRLRSRPQTMGGWTILRLDERGDPGDHETFQPMNRRTELVVQTVDNRRVTLVLDGWGLDAGTIAEAVEARLAAS